MPTNEESIDKVLQIEQDKLYYSVPKKQEGLKMVRTPMNSKSKESITGNSILRKSSNDNDPNIKNLLPKTKKKLKNLQQQRRTLVLPEIIIKGGSLDRLPNIHENDGMKPPGSPSKRGGQSPKSPIGKDYELPTSPTSPYSLEKR